MTMRKILLATASVAALLAVTAAPAEAAKPKRHHAATAPKPADNPLLADWKGPYGGVPPFDKVKVTDFKPALEAAMAQNLREVQAIADTPAPATFDNTIRPLEDSGRALNRVQTVFGVWSSTLSSPELHAVEAEMSPKLAVFGYEITQIPMLFVFFLAVCEGAVKSVLTPEQMRLVWGY